MSESDIFHTDRYNQYQDLAGTLGHVYDEAVSLRNTFADTTRTARLRSDGEALVQSLNEVTKTAETLLEELADEVDAVETDYMVDEGWELSYHDPEDLPENLVFSCRLYESILAAYHEIAWLFDESDPMSGGVPDGDEIPAAADRVTEHFPQMASQLARVDITLPGVDVEPST